MWPTVSRSAPSAAPRGTAPTEKEMASPSMNSNVPSWSVKPEQLGVSNLRPATGPANLPLRNMAPPRNLQTSESVPGKDLDHEGHISVATGVPSKPATGCRLGSLPSRSPTDASGWSSNQPSLGYLYIQSTRSLRRAISHWPSRRSNRSRYRAHNLTKSPFQWWRSDA